MSEVVSLGSELLSWYDEHKRTLPWRDDGVSPYRTWVSEIMLQQTRVDTAIPYFERFMRRFPSLDALASAELDAVLEMWAGLGYYSRARNLHKGARRVVEMGVFPGDVRELKAIPGIGDYVAGAVASIALGLDVPTVDGNIERVLSRVHCVSGSRRSFFAVAERHLVPGRAGDFNQALMDLGATICVPRNPRCEGCPIRTQCQAHLTGRQGEFPVPKRRKSPRPQGAVALAIRRDGGFLLARRPPQGLFGGLFDLPGDLLSGSESPDAAAIRVGEQRLGLSVCPVGAIGTIAHTLSHMRLTLHVLECEWTGQPHPSHYTELRWVSAGQASRLGLSSLAQKAVDLLEGETP